ncbi:hypothetical protein K458DRAFT_348843, partial [Lentithecium fluviatile CBS 122367]
MVTALQRSLLLAALPFLALGSRFQRRADPSTFQLYAYGEGFGGLSVFYADGYAYLGDPNLSNSTDAATVTFTATSTNEWLGSPNTTSVTNSTHSPTWSNVTLFIPETGASDTRVGFLDSNSTTTDVLTSAFRFYGQTAMFFGDSGTFETLWTSLQLENGIRALYWNDTSSGQTPLTLRSIAPSAP